MLDDFDRRLIAATQGGLPLVPQPYRAVADALGTTEAEVVWRLEHLLGTGAIRRIGAVPNHYALGITANGMSVWDIDKVARLAALAGPAARSHDVLFSTRILKKTGLRIAA